MRSKKEEYFVTIKKFAEDYYAKNNCAPSTREIESDTGISRPTVQRYLLSMRERGEIEYGGRRGIETDITRKYKTGFVNVGIVGSIACGVPAFAEENIEEYVRLPESLVGSGMFFLLRARGESMINIGIDDGDLVLVRQQNYANPGQIIVALVGDETTLKRYYPEPEKKRIRLHPENDGMSDIYVRECIIQGIATKVIKNLEK